MAQYSKQLPNMHEAHVAEDASARRGAPSARPHPIPASEYGSSEDYPSDDEEALGMTTEPPEFYDPKADEKVGSLSPICMCNFLFLNRTAVTTASLSSVAFCNASWRTAAAKIVRKAHLSYDTVRCIPV